MNKCSSKKVAELLQNMTKEEYRRRMVSVYGWFLANKDDPKLYHSFISHVHRVMVPKEYPEEQWISLDHLNPDLEDKLAEYQLYAIDYDPTNPFAIASEDGKKFIKFLCFTIGMQNPNGYKRNKRLLIYLCLKAGDRPEEVAKHLSLKVASIHRLIGDVNARGLETLYDDGRETNGKVPLYSKQEIIEAISERIKEPPPVGAVWRGKHIAAFMEERFGFENVPNRRAAENLRRAQQENWKAHRKV